MSAEIDVKGNAFLSVQKCVAQLYGDARLTEVRRAMPEAPRQAIELGTLLSGGWYPVAWYRALYDSILHVCGGGDATIRALGKQSVVNDVGGVYKLVFRLLSPQTVLGQTSKILGLYYRGGSAEVTESGKGHVRVAYRGFAGFNRVLWLELATGGITALELAGARNVRVTRLSGGGDGDTSYENAVDWD